MTSNHLTVPARDSNGQHGRYLQTSNRRSPPAASPIRAPLFLPAVALQKRAPRERLVAAMGVGNRTAEALRPRQMVRDPSRAGIERRASILLRRWRGCGRRKAVFCDGRGYVLAA